MASLCAFEWGETRRQRTAQAALLIYHRPMADRDTDGLKTLNSEQAVPPAAGYLLKHDSICKARWPSARGSQAEVTGGHCRAV